VFVNSPDTLICILTFYPDNSRLKSYARDIPIVISITRECANREVITASISEGRPVVTYTIAIDLIIATDLKSIRAESLNAIG